VPVDATQRLEDKIPICRVVAKSFCTIKIQREFCATADGACIESLVKQLEETLPINLR
jgi:hypothetical protein